MSWAPISPVQDAGTAATIFDAPCGAYRLTALVNHLENSYFRAARSFRMYVDTMDLHRARFNLLVLAGLVESALPGRALAGLAVDIDSRRVLSPSRSRIS